MSTNINRKNNKKDDNIRGDRNPQVMHSSAMTPSIITTINNTNPTPTPICNNGNSNNSGNTNNKNKKPIEPFYESYIEDSFVGHWEREDDDPQDIYNGNNKRDDGSEAEEEDSALHPSTIEFDFDSFGPESFIYAPSAVPAATTLASEGTTPITTQTTIAGGVKNDHDTNNELLNNQCQEKIKEGNIELKDEQEQKKGMENLSTGKDNSEELHIKDLIKFNQNPSDSSDTPKTNSTPIKESDPLSYTLLEAAQIDHKVIEPYKKVISHAGYCHHIDPSSPLPKPGEPAPAVIVFSACYLPDRSRRDYNYVMDHLFLYVLSSLHELIADDYVLVYLHNTQPSTSLTKASTSNTIMNGSSSSPTANASTISAINEDHNQSQNNLPTFTWIKRCYQMIDRKLRKNLKILYLVKPTFWLKTIVIMCKPFISSKFSKKLRFIENMEGLKKCLPVDKLILPASAANI